MSDEAHLIRLKTPVAIYCLCGWSCHPERVNHINQADLDDQLYDEHLEHQRAMRDKDG